MGFWPAIGSLLPLIGKRRDPSAREVDGYLRIAAHAVCGKYNLIHSPESKVHGRFYGVDIKRNG